MDLATLEGWSRAGLFTALFALLGWIFIYCNSRSLAKQGEVTALIYSVEKMLQEIADESNTFWKAAGEQEKNHQSQLFNAYVSFRCNFIEDKIKFMNQKCRSLWANEVDHDAFEEEVVDLIAQLRDAATLDSERASASLDPYSRVVDVNYLSQQLYSALYDFLRTRYMSEYGTRYARKMY